MLGFTLSGILTSVCYCRSFILKLKVIYILGSSLHRVVLKRGYKDQALAPQGTPISRTGTKCVKKWRGIHWSRGGWQDEACMCVCVDACVSESVRCEPARPPPLGVSMQLRPAAVVSGLVIYRCVDLPRAPPPLPPKAPLSSFSHHSVLHSLLPSLPPQLQFSFFFFSPVLAPFFAPAHVNPRRGRVRAPFFFFVVW